nr:MAG TPA: Cytosine specific methyltransferase [Caudoviricetes sp.]
MITKLNFTDRTIKSYAIRKLTPKECFRLMGVRDNVIGTMQSSNAQAAERLPDWKGKGKPEDMAISASQQYKQAGNSIVVDVLAAIYEQLWYPKTDTQQNRQLTLFPDYDIPKAPPKSDKEKIIISTFSGYDSQLLAADLLAQRHPDFRYTCAGWSEIDKYASQMHNLIFPQFADCALGDITKIDWHKVKRSLEGREVDLFTYSSPCFVAGTLVLTTHGFKPIEDVTTSDYVTTHRSDSQRVLRIGSRPFVYIVRVKGMCIDEILCTPNHPFYVREMYRHGHKWKRAFREPQWKEAAKLTTSDYLGIPINRACMIPDWDGVTLHYGGHDTFQVNKISEMLNSSHFWYVLGRYVGDGWTREDDSHKQVLFACSDRNEQTLQDALKSLGFNPTVTDKYKSCRRYTINSKELVAFVNRYGHGAANKRIDYATLCLPETLLSKFLQGYTDSDGCRSPKNDEYKIATISRELAYGIQQIVAKVHHRPSRVYKVAMPSKTKIEGREVNQQDFYQVVWHTDIRKQDKAFYEDGYIWYPCNGVEQTDRQEVVYNMEVATDNSYTANGTIVHNCQDISQAGKQMGLQEGSDTRSALLWRVADAVEVLRPKYLLQENVAALVSQKFMPDFQKWLDKLSSLGYISKWQRLNSRNYGVPQNRDRVFCISMRRDVAFDYQFPQPIPLTTRLEDILEQEVDDRYFLKDDSVGRFLKANDTDNALFLQFDLPPTHEAAMFLKTWLQNHINTINGWDMELDELVDSIEGMRLVFDSYWKSFCNYHTFPFEGFEELFKENMERKKDEDK